MTEALTWRQRWAIVRQVASVVVRGGDLLRRVGEAAGVVAPPQAGAHAMSAHQVFAAVIRAALADKTWAQAEAMAGRADAALNSGDLLVRVVKNHGRVAQDDIRLGIEAAALLAPRLAAEIVTFLGGPLGGVAVGVLQMWLTGILLGKPVQPKDPAYRLPEGPGNISTGA